MKNSIIENMTKKAQENIENTLIFYDKLKNNYYLKDSFNDIKSYLNTVFGINNLELILIDKTNADDELIYSHSLAEEDVNCPFSYTVDVNDNIHVTYNFKANCETHNDEITENHDDLNTLFNLISPILYFTYLKEIIEELKLTDNVTNLYNRTYLVQHLDKMLPLARREDKKVAFLMVGIDHFKAVIDEFDYEIGDKVLVELAAVLKETIRTSDIVVRLEGDEFLVVLHNVMNEENAFMVANKIIETFKEKKVVVNATTNQTLMKTLCIGISMFPNDSLDMDQLLKNADIGMYEARNEGRNKVKLFAATKPDDIELF